VVGVRRVDENILRGFCHRSREWSRATRGMELFKMAATDLRAYVEADSGFFVYRKRILTNAVTPHRAKVYAPWGVFSEGEKQLQTLVEDALSRLELLNPLMERWMLVEEMPDVFQQIWKDYSLLEVGIWPLVSRERIIGAIVVAQTKLEPRVCVVTRTALMDACAAQVSLALDLILAGRIAEEASQRDLLTGLLNRRGLEARLPQLLLNCEDSGSQLVFGLIDMDDLKQVNDTEGHPSGDTALRQIAEIIGRNVRAGDLVARFGGDEFAVFMQCDAPDASVAMERIRQAVEQQSDRLSVSVGGAVWGMDGNSLEQCYAVADERLYVRKRLAKTDTIL
jgi:diguanylate cyclase (GGDEF)-like protein